MICPRHPTPGSTKRLISLQDSGLIAPEEALYLLEEADGNPDAAITAYQESLAANPQWDKARSRLRGLESERGL